MSALVFIVVLAAALAHAAWNALLKGRSADPQTKMTGIALVWALGLGPMLPFLPPLERTVWPYLGATVAVHVVYMALLVRAYRHADLGLVYPIIRGLPPAIVFIAFAALGKDAFELISALGVMTISLGVVALAFGESRSASPGVWPNVLAVTLCIAAYLIVDGLGVGQADSAVAYWMWMSALQGAIFASLSLLKGGRSLSHSIWRSRWVVLLAGVLSSGGYGVALWAFTQADVAKVAALRETSVLFAALIATFFLGEPFGRRRFVLSVCVAVGAVLLRLGE